jgi:SAM-dependent methyltransferase
VTEREIVVRDPATHPLESFWERAKSMNDHQFKLALTEKGYDPTAFWRTFGARYWPQPRPDPKKWTVQEQQILRLLEHKEFRNVLDVGCGDGRLGMLLRERTPGLQYTGLDLSSVAIEVAGQNVPNADLYTIAFKDWNVPLRWDLVICSEVLLHVPPAEAPLFLEKLLIYAERWVLLVDWYPSSEPREIAAWNFDHHDLLVTRLGEPAVRVGEQGIWLIER